MVYYKYFLNHNIDMKFSTISIAEYCVIGNVSELPLRNLKIFVFVMIARFYALFCWCDDRHTLSTVNSQLTTDSKL